MTDLAIRITERNTTDIHVNFDRVKANASRTSGIDCMSCTTHNEVRARIAENTGNTTAEAIKVAAEVNAQHAEPDSFAARLEAFVAGCRFIQLADYESLDRGTNEPYPHDIRDGVISLDVPKAKNARYARLWNTDRSGERRSIFAFVDMKGGPIDKKGLHSRGSVLKAASWKKPAPHARGDIMADDFGLTNMQWTGPAYLA